MTLIFRRNSLFKGTDHTTNGNSNSLHIKPNTIEQSNKVNHTTTTNNPSIVSETKPNDTATLYKSTSNVHKSTKFSKSTPINQSSSFHSNILTKPVSSNSKLSFFSSVNIQDLKPKTTSSKVSFISDLLKENNQLFIGLTET